MTLSPGERLGPYEILQPIGAGGMGEVYRARDTRLNRAVAVKVLPAMLTNNPACRQRLEREARAASNLNHPHICVLHDIGEDRGIVYLVMEHPETGEAPRSIGLCADASRKNPRTVSSQPEIWSRICFGFRRGDCRLLPRRSFR